MARTSIISGLIQLKHVTPFKGKVAGCLVNRKGTNGWEPINEGKRYSGEQLRILERTTDIPEGWIGYIRSRLYATLEAAEQSNMPARAEQTAALINKLPAIA